MEWTEANFDEMCWHDNHVHGLQIVEAEDGTGELILDIDYILEWLPPENGALTFRVAPATLTFHDVFGLKILVDWESLQAGMGPFSIDGIEREKREHPNGYVDWKWIIRVNWPEGSLSFTGTRFTQRLRSDPVTTQSPSLEPAQRKSPPSDSQ